MAGGIILSILFICLFIYLFIKSAEQKRLEGERFKQLMQEATELNSDIEKFAMNFARENQKIGLVYTDIEIEGGKLFQHDYKPDIEKINKIISTHRIFYTQNISDLGSLANSVATFKFERSRIYSDLRRRILELPDSKTYKYR